MVSEITDLKSFSKAINVNGLVIIDFQAKWCAPCKAFAPKFQSLSETYKNVGFYKIDADNDAVKDITDVCQIDSLPTFCFFYNGKYLDKIKGADEVALKNAIISLTNQTQN